MNSKEPTSKSMLKRHAVQLGEDSKEQIRENVLLDLYKIYAYNPNDAVGNPLTPFGNFCEGYQACEAQQAKELEALKHDLYSYMEAANGYTNEIMEQAKVIAELREQLANIVVTDNTPVIAQQAQTIAELVEALEAKDKLIEQAFQSGLNLRSEGYVKLLLEAKAIKPK